MPKEGNKQIIIISFKGFMREECKMGDAQGG